MTDTTLIESELYNVRDALEQFLTLAMRDPVALRAVPVARLLAVESCGLSLLAALTTARQTATPPP